MSDNLNGKQFARTFNKYSDEEIDRAFARHNALDPVKATLDDHGVAWSRFKGHLRKHYEYYGAPKDQKRNIDVLNNWIIDTHQKDPMHFMHIIDNVRSGALDAE